ncbi:hypothetical protein IKW75_00355 [Candidatus Saccharibacteria bacterium]|nr:hypothetical protein [Candidatus Saccharibacteria bacterium]
MAKKLKCILAAFVAALSLGALTFAFNAADVAAEQAPIHLQVSPVKQKISLTPGASYTGTFKVQNAGAMAFNYSVNATPYSVTGENYNPDYTSVTTYSHMADWITFDKATEKGLLQPGETVNVKYTVNVPKDAPAGGQYAALMAQTEDGNDNNATIAVVHRVGMILYAAVPGETRSEGEIIKNTVNTFYFNPPLTVTSLVKNTGNIEQTAKYHVKVYPLFSNEAYFNTDDAEEGAYDRDVVPETSRFNSITWEQAPSIGIFYVEQSIEFAGQTSTVGKLVLICPLWLLFVVFALLFFIIFWLISRARDRKRAKSRSHATTSEKTEKNDKESTKKEEK